MAEKLFPVHRSGPMKFSRSQVLIACIGLVALQAAILLIMGREPICKCGYVKLWHGVVMSAENSQHVSDWYSPSHPRLHLLRTTLACLRVPLSFGMRLILAVAIEASWELIENTDYLINRYRGTTVSLDYYGDSVINSVSDTLFMVAGFFLASRPTHTLPVTKRNDQPACQIPRWHLRRRRARRLTPP